MQNIESELHASKICYMYNEVMIDNDTQLHTDACKVSRYLAVMDGCVCGPPIDSDPIPS